jgi:hypothetical protein
MNLLEFIIKYWLEALFGVILTGLSFLVRRLFQEAKTARHAASAVQTGIRCMLRDRIIHSYENYVRLGYCPLAVRENTEEMHAAYKALGGNGAVDHVVAEMNELPTVKKEDNIK